jgi:putative tricarboxylic transport membrane protein
MKSNDAPIGAGLLVLSLLVLWHVSGYPPAPGQPYSAALFPGIAAVGLAIAAIGLIVSGMRQGHEAKQRDSARTASRTPGVDPVPDDAIVDESADESAEVVAAAEVPSRVLAIVLTGGSILFYIAASQYLGFVISGVLLLSVLMWAYGVRPLLIPPVALVSTLVIHFFFYRVLSVPLPWGVLQPIAW